MKLSPKAKRTVIISSISIVVLILFLISTVLIDYSYYGDPFERAFLSMTRTQAGKEFPDFDGNINDIRVTVVDRSAMSTPYTLYTSITQGMKYKQIYYGYCSDGVWYDYPCENFELRALSKMSIYDDSVAFTAQSNHCVKIGPYLLLAFSVYDEQLFGFVEDSLGSDVRTLTEYVTNEPGSGANCGWIIDAYHNEYDILVKQAFFKWYYIVLEYDEMPEDYEVKFYEYIKYDGVSDVPPEDLRTIVGEDGKKEIYQYHLSRSYTYENIQYALARESNGS